MTDAELSTHRIAIVAVIATFFVVGWLSLKIMHKFETEFPSSANRIGAFVTGLLFSITILACSTMDYFIEGRRHHDLSAVRGGFGAVILVVSFGLLHVITNAMEALIPDREELQDWLKPLFFLGCFAFLLWSLWQIFPN